MPAPRATSTGRAARRQAERQAERRGSARVGRSLRAGFGGALIAGVALLALGLQDATPGPLAALFDTSRTRSVADEQRVEEPEETADPSTSAAAPSSQPPVAVPVVEPEKPVGPVAPPAPSMPSGSVIRVAQGGSIASAVEKAGPGTTVLVPGGTYSGFAVGNNGAAGKPITIQAVPGEKVTISGGGGGGGGLVTLNQASNITMIGITVKGSDSHGIFGEGAKNIVLRDVEVADSQDGGVVFFGSSNIKVQRCDVHGNNARGTSASNEAVSFDHTSNFEVSFSKVHGNGEEGIDAKYESSGGKIFANTVTGNRGPNIYVDSAKDIEVFNNTVTGATEGSKPGISVAVENLSDTRRAANVKIYNNVIRNNAGGGIGFWTESGGAFSGIQILNNTILNNNGDDLKFLDSSFSGANILRNNILGSSPGNPSGFASDHNIVGAVGGILDEALKPITGSKTVGAGSADGAPDFDLAGKKRSGRVDIGAFQLPEKDPAEALTGLIDEIHAATGQLATGLATVLGSSAAPVDATPGAEPSAPATPSGAPDNDANADDAPPAG